MAISPGYFAICRSQELLDRIVDRLFAVDLGEDQVVELVAELSQFANVVPRSIRALDLAVTEEVEGGEQIGGEKFQAAFVVLSPVVAVGELEAINVPLGGGEVARDDLPGDLVGR